MLRASPPPSLPSCFPRSPGRGGGLLKDTHMDERLSCGDVPRQPKLQSSRSGSAWGEGQEGAQRRPLPAGARQPGVGAR